MKLTRRHTQLFTAGAIGLGTAVAFALPAGAAVVSQSPPSSWTVKLGDTATLKAKGAVVFAPFKVVCPADSNVSVTITITENVAGGFTASGSSVTSFYCTGQWQTLRQAVTPTDHAFVKGAAFGEVRLDPCGPRDCPPRFDQHEIQIVKS